MIQTRPAEHWDERYRAGDAPWDMRRPEPRLTELVERLTVPRGVALDLGCGTGDNAMWLAEHDYEAVGVDIAAAAVAEAQRRAVEAGLKSVRFVCASVLGGLPVAAGGARLALDRGCFHTVSASDRARYAANVAEALAAGGWWLVLCGNADEVRAEGEEGPPQLTAAEVVDAVEGLFEVVTLEHSRFTRDDGAPGSLAWRGVLRKR